MTAWTDDRKRPSAKKREIPKMPEGYYSGDKPNPNLRAFVEAHLRERPYDPETDNYDVPPFDHPIETTKATAIYNMHTYWSKKPHDAIRQYIRHYTKPGDLVLDPFCGSGGTALAALMEGRKAIAIDRSPAATFITKNYCTPVDVDELKAGGGGGGRPDATGAAGRRPQHTPSTRRSFSARAAWRRWRYSTAPK